MIPPRVAGRQDAGVDPPGCAGEAGGDAGTHRAPRITGFDPGAATFAEERGFPVAIGGQLRAAVLTRLCPDPCLLEPGIGAGRIATPFMVAGCRYVGLDNSPAMLSRCRTKLVAGKEWPVLVRGDMRRLPFSDLTFDGVIAASIFRAARPWQAAAAEIGRVLARPGVIFLVHHESEPDSIESVLARRKRAFLERTGVGAYPAGGASDADVAAFFVGRGAALDTVETARWASLETPRLVVERHLGGHRVAGEPIAAGLRRELEAFARERYGSLDAPEPVVRYLRIRVLHLSAQ